MGCEGCGEVWASPLMCKVQGTLAGLLALCGCVMVMAGIVVMAGDCPPDRSWLLLVWGLITLLLYGLVALSAVDRSVGAEAAVEDTNMALAVIFTLLNQRTP